MRAAAEGRQPAFLEGGGTLGALIRGHDWSASPFGRPETWPQSLRSALSICLHSDFPTAIYWGPEFRLLYNDAWRPILAERHPVALGRPAAEVWSDIWPVVGPQLARVMETGEGFSTFDQLLPMVRGGLRRETYWNYSFTPIRGEDGAIVGIFNQGHETTERVLGDRRGRFLLELSDRLRALSDPRAVVEMAQEALGEHLKANRVGYGEVDAQARYFTTQRNWTDGSVPSREGTHDLAGFGPQVLASLRAGIPLLIQDAAADPRTNAPESLAAFDAIDTRAVMTASLVKGGCMRAALYVHAREPRPWTEHDASLVTDVAERTWSAVERARAEERLRQSEARFRGVFDARLTGLTIFDAGTGETLAINDTFLAMTGHTRADFDEGRWDWRDFTLPEYLHLDEKAAAQARERGWWDTFEKDYRRRDGSRFPVRIASAPLPGEPGRVLVSVQDISEARAAEAELRESETRFRNMADNAPVIMWVTDPSGIRTYLNARWYEFTGQEPGAGEGYGWLHAVHPDDRPAAEAAFVSANAERRNYRVDFRLRRADGAYRWVIDAAAARVSEVGQYLGYVGSVIDIDERREMEDALRASEERFRLATESAAIGTWDFDPITGALLWDERCKALFGLSPDAPVDYETFLAGLHPDDRAASDAAVQRALAPEGPPDFAVEYRTMGLEDGIERWIAARGRAFFESSDTTRRARRFVGTVMDITAAKQAEEILERRVAEALAERKLLADIVERTDALVQVADLDFRWMAVNRAAANEFERVFGVRPTVGTSMLDVLEDRPEHREAVRAVWGRALAGEEFTEVGEFGDPGRERRFYEMKYNVLRDARGERIGAYQFVHDVTQRVMEQRRLAEAEEALRQSQKMEAVGQLTGGVAHDFNNLLTIIRSSTDLLRRPDLAEERRKRYVDAIADTVDRAAKLTGQLLAFARRQALKPEVFDAVERLDGVTEMLRTVMGSRIVIRTEMPPTRCFVTADASQYETALINMALNARDAMDGEGELTLRVEALDHMPSVRGQTETPGGFVAVSLTDTGHGIPADKLPQIFEPFFTTKEVGKGTGLGLSQVYGFAKQSGGDVHVESEPGRGSTFRLYLPRAERGPEQDNEANLLQDWGESGRGRRVLVVEDNVEVGRFSTQILQDLGYETAWAANGDEALRLLEEVDGFDVVFSDVVMPGMSGVELGQEIRRRRPDMPVVLTSGYSHVLAEEGRHGFELLHKPYAAEELSQVLQRATRGRLARV